MTDTIQLGFEVGTGREVRIPMAHTFVTGQTQLSGKTTTLQAIVARAERPAVAFVTKRGETLTGNQILPFLPKQQDRPIHWRLVETILASTLGQKQMKYERFWLVNAAKGAKSLEDVRRNVDRLRKKAKGNSGDVYELLGEYLDLVLPEMRQLQATNALPLKVGLNVMDLTNASGQLQALVIRATLEHINLHHRGILTVFPEAWEFAPRSRNAPAKDEAIAMARKGAVLENFLLCDSQDIAGVETTIRQAASVWILGVQRELNELKRTLASIPAGTKKPKADEIATLGKGQFYACWGSHAIKTYVRPVWMNESEAHAYAMGLLLSLPKPPVKEQQVSPAEADALREENRQLHKKIDELLERLAHWEPQPESAESVKISTASEPYTPTRKTNPPPAWVQPPAEVQLDRPWLDGEESVYRRILDRLLQEPKILQLVQISTRLEVLEKVERISVDGTSLRGRVARLILDGFFDKAVTVGEVMAEMSKTGFRTAPPNITKELTELSVMGFLTRDNKWWKVVPSAKENVLRTKQ